MTTRAVAVASDRSNAVGAVELECTDDGLVIVHRGVGAFQTGYAPGAVTTGTRVVVPWGAVREASLEGERLFLEVDEAFTPHHRLLLGAFSEGDPPDPRELRRQRLLLRTATVATTVVGGLLVALTLLRMSSSSGALAAVLLGIFASLLVFALGTAAEHRLGLAGTNSEGARMAFASELSSHLPRFVVTATSAAPKKPPPHVPLPSFQSLLPRTTTAVVITMSAAVLGAVLTASWVSRAPVETRADRPELPRAVERVEPRAELEAVQGGASPSPVAAALQPAIPKPAAAPVAEGPTPVPSTAEGVLLAGTCSCKRSDSLLWRDGLPKLSMVLIERRSREHNQHDHLELELGIVNNGDAPLGEVSLLVRFFEKDPPPSKKRTPTFDRPVYFEGPLGPGQAIKWHVEARGNDFEVEGLPTATLDPTGSDFAPTNLLAELLRANHRPIRLHGAMMLAYLGDPRAKDGALGLREALREDEAPYLDRLVWALSPVRTCAIESPEVAGPRPVKLCVFNASAEPQKGLALRIRALDRPFRHTTPVEPPPLVLAEKVWKLTGDLAPNQGALAAVTFDPSNPDGVATAAIEAHADRAELVY